jgi:hypothetical protein
MPWTVLDAEYMLTMPNKDMAQKEINIKLFKKKLDFI